MRKKVNEKGQALVMVLFCSVVAFLFIMAVLFMVNRGEQASGQERRYETALDAADAGISLSVKFLDEKTLKITSGTLAGFVGGIDYSALDPCLQQKLETACIPTGCSSTWTSCSADRLTLDPQESADISFTVRGTNGPLYDVDAKIVDARRGVTGSPPGDLSTGGVVTSDGALTPVNLPYFYYIVEVAAQQQNSNELAHLTYVYAD